MADVAALARACADAPDDDAPRLALEMLNVNENQLTPTGIQALPQAAIYDARQRRLSNRARRGHRAGR